MADVRQTSYCCQMIFQLMIVLCFEEVKCYITVKHYYCYSVPTKLQSRKCFYGIFPLLCFFSVWLKAEHERGSLAVTI